MCEHLSIYHGDDMGLTPVEKHGSDMPYIGNLPAARMPRFKPRPHVLLGELAALRRLPRGREGDGARALAAPTIRIEDFVTMDDAQFGFPCTVISRFRDNARWPARSHQYADLAASVQRALESALRKVRERLRSISRSSRLCYAGGVALNGVANRRVLIDGVRHELHTAPAADDAGPAIGAAYYGLAQLTSGVRGARLRSDSLGRRYRKPEVDHAIVRLPVSGASGGAGDPREQVADLLRPGASSAGSMAVLNSVRAPSARGTSSATPGCRTANAGLTGSSGVSRSGRSLPPCSSSMQPSGSTFPRPPARWSSCSTSAPSVRSAARPSRPSCTLTARRGRKPSTRTATPPSTTSSAPFRDRSGVPMLVSTSMNVSAEPMETPREALWLLLTTDLDALVVGGALVTKASDFRSILDLRPVRTARVVGREGEAVRVAAMSPHGPVEHELRAGPAGWLMAFDGRTSARELLDCDGGPDERELATLLSWLFRYSLIDFENDVNRAT
jgi:carbamoyltransferase